MEKTTMSVQELSAQLGISLPKAYALAKPEGFPSIRIGTRISAPSIPAANTVTCIASTGFTPPSHTVSTWRWPTTSSARSAAAVC